MIDLLSDDAVATVSDTVGDLLIELHATLASRGRTETVTVPIPVLYEPPVKAVCLPVGCHAALSTRYRLGSWSSKTDTEREFIRRVLRRTARVAP